MTDTSFWTQLNPKLIQLPTRKQYFGRYLCKLVLDAPGARLIDSTQDDLSIALAERLETHRNYNYGGSWWAHRNQSIGKTDLGQLAVLRDIKRDYPEIRIRIEEPAVQIYTVDEDLLRVIASRFDPDYSHTLTAVELPTEETVKLLKEGKIITPSTSRINFQYKVILRDGTYPVETKRQVLSYIQNLGEDAKASKGTTEMLAKNFGYIWGCFVYVNDPNVLTFLNLICPNIVQKIHELVKLDE